MPLHLPSRPVKDRDIHAYCTYVQRLTERHDRRDNQTPVSFRVWFQWTYKATPIDQFVGTPPQPPHTPRVAA